MIGNKTNYREMFVDKQIGMYQFLTLNIICHQTFKVT